MPLEPFLSFQVSGGTTHWAAPASQPTVRGSPGLGRPAATRVCPVPANEHKCSRSPQGLGKGSEGCMDMPNSGQTPTSEYMPQNKSGDKGPVRQPRTACVRGEGHHEGLSPACFTFSSDLQQWLCNRAGLGCVPSANTFQNSSLCFRLFRLNCGKTLPVYGSALALPHHVNRHDPGQCFVRSATVLLLRFV